MTRTEVTSRHAFVFLVGYLGDVFDLLPVLKMDLYCLCRISCIESKVSAVDRLNYKVGRIQCFKAAEIVIFFILTRGFVLFLNHLLRTEEQADPGNNSVESLEPVYFPSGDGGD